MRSHNVPMACACQAASGPDGVMVFECLRAPADCPYRFVRINREVGGCTVPFYRVTLGGCCNSGGARFGFAIGQLPAKALPDFTNDLAEDFVCQGNEGESFVDYFDRMGLVVEFQFLGFWI